MEIHAIDIELGQTYDIKGSLVNGSTAAEVMFGIVDANAYEITRPIVRITDDMMFCECGRIFWLDGLEIKRPRDRNYSKVIA